MDFKNETVRIFMMPQDFPCGPQSSCCGPIGQSEEDIENLKGSIEEGLGYEVEILDVMNHDAIKNYDQVVELLSYFGPMALPVIALGNDVVSTGSPTPEMAVAAIREKANQA